MTAYGPRTHADEVLQGRDLSGKTMIVTGANTGIGYETARALCAAGAEVVFACRSVQSATEAVQRTLQRHPGGRAIAAELDLASADSIKQFVATLAAPVVHVLVCNAGLIANDYQQTRQGIELTVGVCHHGHFLLARQLMPRLLAASSPRVVMVASESHRSPRTLDFNRFPMTREQFRTMVAYGQAKLCNVLFANELQRRYGGRGLVACSLHPGTLVTTDIGRGSLLARALMRLISPFTKNCNQGAATSVWAAVHDPAAELAGQYLRDCRVSRATAESADPEAARRLWDLSEAWCRTVAAEGSWP